MKKIYILAAVTLALAACEKNEDNRDVSPVAAKISATIGESVSTRAKDAEWSAGDRIGISSTVGTVVGPYINVEYTTSKGDGMFIGVPLYFYKPMTLFAYYPFSEWTTPGPIEVVTDANKQKPENQPQIDFLWDSKTNQDHKDFSAEHPDVKFTFAHKMSKLTFAFKGSKEVEDDGKVIAPEVKVSDIVAYEIEGLVLKGSFDTFTGICAIDNSAASEKLKIDFTKGYVKENVFLDPLIVFPQQPGNNSVTLHVYTDELENSSVLQHYTCTLTFGGGELKPGTEYKYTIQISKVGLKLKQMNIVDWNTEREVNVTATIDGGWEIDEQQ